MTAKLTTLIVLVLLATTIVTGCAAPTPAAAPTQAPAPPPTAVPPTAAPAAPAATAVPPTAAPAAPAATEPPPTAAPAAPAAAAPECIEIGSSIPLTGKFGSLGSQVKPGYAYAVADINAAGGIYVKEFDKKIPLCLTVYDDESDPDQGREQARDGLRRPERRSVPGRRRQRHACRHSSHRRKEQGPLLRCGLCPVADPPEGLQVSVLAVREVARPGQGRVRVPQRPDSGRSRGRPRSPSSRRRPTGASSWGICGRKTRPSTATRSWTTKSTPRGPRITPG